MVVAIVTEVEWSGAAHKEVHEPPPPAALCRFYAIGLNWIGLCGQQQRQWQQAATGIVSTTKELLHSNCPHDPLNVYSPTDQQLRRPWRS